MFKNFNLKNYLPYKNWSIKRLCLILLSAFGYFIISITAANKAYEKDGINGYINVVCRFFKALLLFALLPSLLFLAAAKLTQALGTVSQILSRLGAIYAYLSCAALTAQKTTLKTF